MEFGIRFLPDVGLDERSGTDYWAQALYLNKSQGGIYICGTMKISLCDPLKLLHTCGAAVTYEDGRDARSGSSPHLRGSPSGAGSLISSGAGHPRTCGAAPSGAGSLISSGAGHPRTCGAAPSVWAKDNFRCGQPSC